MYHGILYILIHFHANKDVNHKCYFKGNSTAFSCVMEEGKALQIHVYTGRIIHEQIYRISTTFPIFLGKRI